MKRHNSTIAMQLCTSVAVTVIVIFFSDVFYYRWTAWFDLSAPGIARASEPTPAENAAPSTTFGAFTASPLPIAPREPVSLHGLTSSTPPSLQAASALVLDRASDIVLFEEKQDKRWPIASITKLVTAVILLDYKDQRPQPLPPVEIRGEDMREGRNFFQIGDIVAWDDLFDVMLAGSSNTATAALIRSTGMDEATWRKFINQKLLFWELQKTQIREVTGLSPGNISTAYEIAKIFDRSLERKEIRDALARTEIVVTPLNRGEAVRVDTTNLFLTGEVRHGFTKPPLTKTGYIDESGYNIVADVAHKDGGEVVVVVLGAPSHYERFTEVVELGEWTFGSFSWN